MVEINQSGGGHSALFSAKVGGTLVSVLGPLIREKFPHLHKRGSSDGDPNGAAISCGLQKKGATEYGRMDSAPNGNGR